jgi:dTDP-4-dehydrorhamnose 3,5-epimerase
MKNLAKWDSTAEIEGLLLGKNRTVSYNNSLLVEIKRKPLNGLYNEIDHLYWIITQRGVIRKWGVHKHTTDIYSAVYGEIETALWDSREKSPTYGKTLIIQLNSSNGDALKVPPGIWHTFRAKSDEAVLLNSKSPVWNSDNPDKITHELSESIPSFSWPESE